MSTPARSGFQFEGCTLDLVQGVLRVQDREVSLRPKSFEVLRYLVENAGRLVSKDELLQAIWPNVTVTDDSLKRCVSEIRLALRDSEQRIIRTMPRRGYLFAALACPAQTGIRTSSQGTTVPQDCGRRLTDIRTLRNWSLALLASLCVLAMAVQVGRVWLGPSRLPFPDRPSVAVLAFANLSGDPQQEYFSDGISDDLTTALGKFSNLFVIARHSAYRFKRMQVDAKDVGEQLGVRYLVYGSVRREAELLRITAQLVDAATGKQVWGERYDRGVTDLFAVQDDIAQEIVVALVAQVTKAELERAQRKRPETLTAHDYYLQANALMKQIQRDSRGEFIAAARQLYERALAAEPTYAPAFQGLAHTYVSAWQEPTKHLPLAGEYRQQATLDLARLLAERAIALDPTLAEAHATLGFVLRWEYRLEEGIAQFERAFALNPNLADGRFGNVLNHQGRAPEAIEFMKSVMRLDPFHPPVYTQYLGNSYYLVGDYETAAKLLQSAALRMPSYRPVFVWLAAAAAQVGRDAEARTAAAEVLRLQPEFTIASWLGFLRLAKPEDAHRLAEGLRKAGLPE